MNRKRYLCYAALVAVPIVFLLALLMLYSLPLMLLALLGLVVILGIIYRRKPQIFSFLRKPTDNIPEPINRPLEPLSHNPKEKTFLMLISVNSSSKDSITINNPRFIIGRARDCQYVIDNGRVSKHHVIIEYDYNEKVCYATDVSTNGTFLNSVRLTRNVRAPLKQGDTLQITSTAYSVEYVHY